jgi:hypothetical protein
MSQQPQTQIEPDEEKTPTTEHLKIEWHLNRDLLGVASATSNTGGFVSFFTKKVVLFDHFFTFING